MSETIREAIHFLLTCDQGAIDEIPEEKRRALVEKIQAALAARASRPSTAELLSAAERDRDEAMRLARMANRRASRLFEAVQKANEERIPVAELLASLGAERREHALTQRGHANASTAWFYAEERLAASEERARRAEQARDEANRLAEGFRNEAVASLEECRVAQANTQRSIEIAEAHAARSATLERALVGCASILESLAVAVKWEIAPEIMEEIRFGALPAARSALAPPPAATETPEGAIHE